MQTDITKAYQKYNRAYWEQFYVEILCRKKAPTPYFDFKNIPNTENLDFEEVNWENAHYLYEMFKEDDSPFVNPPFKSWAGVEYYLAPILLFNRFSPKRAGSEWFFKTKQGECAGILHLYGLSVEHFGGANQRACIGFATRSAYRRQGLTTEAVKQLIRHIFGHFDRQIILATTHSENTPTQNFLAKIGFRLTRQRRKEKEMDYVLEIKN
jgi:RimJ/RimL family protein N-acetyltransferase